jgi:hypothetical protein
MARFRLYHRRSMARAFPITGGTFYEPDDWVAWLRDMCGRPYALPYFDWEPKNCDVPTEGVLWRLQQELAGTGLDVALADGALRLFENGERTYWVDVRSIALEAAPNGHERLIALARDRHAELVAEKRLWNVVRRLVERRPDASEVKTLLADLLLREGGRSLLDLATRAMPDFVGAHLKELVPPEGDAVWDVFARAPEAHRAAMLETIVAAGPEYAEAIASYVAKNEAVRRSPFSALVREHPATRRP